jgi:hypothetical protein
MENTLLKLMAQLGLIAVCIWVVAGAFGQRNQVTAQASSCKGGWRKRVKGDVWQRGCVGAPYAQGTYQPGLQMSVAGTAA